MLPDKGDNHPTRSTAGSGTMLKYVAMKQAEENLKDFIDELKNRIDRLGR
jgi:hypothetical protein